MNFYIYYFCENLNIRPNFLQILCFKVCEKQIWYFDFSLVCSSNFSFFQAQQRRPLPIGAGTIRQPNESDNNTPNILQTAPSPSGGTSIPTLTPGASGAAAPPSNRHKNVAWIENQIRKDQHEAVNPKYKLPFKSKDDAIKRLLR